MYHAGGAARSSPAVLYSRPMAYKTFECPHCGADVPAERDELEQAAAVLTCPTCRQRVYLTMGRLSNFQPGGMEGRAPDPGYIAEYDSGA